MQSCGFSHVLIFVTTTLTGHRAILTAVNSVLCSLIVATPGLLSDLRALPLPKCCGHATAEGWGVCV